MRNNYVGDIGDYFKYGLLRHLSGHTANDGFPSLRLGMVWYLYPDPCRDTDGLHLDYLGESQRARFRHYDPVLYDALGSLIAENARTVLEVEKRGILPADTCFFSSPLSLTHFSNGNASAIAQRLSYRRAWLEQALEATKEANIVFVDPDNGLQVKSIKMHQDKGPKFCFYEELQEFWKRGQSLVIYQHCNRSGSVENQIKRREAELQDHLPGIAFLESIYFPAYTGRIFIVIGFSTHSNPVMERLMNFKQLWQKLTGYKRV